MLTIRIIPNDSGNPAGKLADAELHFTDAAGPLAGLKLIGFAIWERRTGTGRNVTFPARQYSVNGERRSFALLRPITDTTAQNAIRDAILQAYAQYAGELTIEQPTVDEACAPAGRAALARVLARGNRFPRVRLSQLKNPSPLALAVSEELCRVAYADLARSLRS